MSVGGRLLEVRGLVRHFAVNPGLLGRGPLVRAVDVVDLDLDRSEVLGLVGESGSGKTTLGRSVLRLIEPDAGTIRFDGIDVRALRGRDLRALRRRMQIVFQDPTSALNPRLRVRTLVGEPLLVHGLARGAALRDRVAELLAEVGLEPEAMERFPREFSGGQRQRIGIARALALRPDFVVLDEPVSSLDVSVQAQIINLLVDLQRRHRVAYLFIAHDLALVGHLADRVAVMYLGRIVEQAPTRTVLDESAHPYTRALIAASPPPDPVRARRTTIPIPGEIPSPVDRPDGCAFHPRCPLAVDACRTESPVLAPVGPDHLAACHRAAEVMTMDHGATEGGSPSFNRASGEQSTPRTPRRPG